jgi:hypothetical protein
MLDAATMIGSCHARHRADVCLVIGYAKTPSIFSPSHEHTSTI